MKIVLKWWRVRTDREHVDMSFIKPLITTILNVSSEWYYSVCKDDRYNGLMTTLDIPAPTAERAMRYTTYIDRAYISSTLEDCISKGDGTPVQLEEL